MTPGGADVPRPGGPRPGGAPSPLPAPSSLGGVPTDAEVSKCSLSSLTMPAAAAADVRVLLAVRHRRNNTCDEEATNHGNQQERDGRSLRSGLDHSRIGSKSTRRVSIRNPLPPLFTYSTTPHASSHPTRHNTHRIAKPQRRVRLSRDCTTFIHFSPQGMAHDAARLGLAPLTAPDTPQRELFQRTQGSSTSVNSLL